MLDAHRVLALAVVLAVSVVECSPGEAPAETPVPSPTSVATVAALDEMPPLHPSVDDWQEGRVEVVAGDGTRHVVAVRLATTAEQRSHGLMEVPDLPDGAGMWFAYDQDRTGGFWMKNTLVALDIVYVGADDRIVSVAEADPCRQDPCPTYEPEGVYRNVLEVPGGYLERIGAGVGDAVRLVAP